MKGELRLRVSTTPINALLKSDVKYRFVIDLASLQSDTVAPAGQTNNKRSNLSLKG